MYLEKGVSETDGGYALVRYICLEDGKMVNALLMVEGYAKAAITPPDALYSEQILTSEDESRRKGLGLWALVLKEESKAGTSP